MDRLKGFSHTQLKDLAIPTYPSLRATLPQPEKKNHNSEQISQLDELSIYSFSRPEQKNKERAFVSERKKERKKKAFV